MWRVRAGGAPSTPAAKTSAAAKAPKVTVHRRILPVVLVIRGPPYRVVRARNLPLFDRRDAIVSSRTAIHERPAEARASTRGGDPRRRERAVTSPAARNPRRRFS